MVFRLWGQMQLSAQNLWGQNPLFTSKFLKYVGANAPTAPTITTSLVQPSGGQKGLQR